MCLCVCVCVCLCVCVRVLVCVCVCHNLLVLYFYRHLLKSLFFVFLITRMQCTLVSTPKD